MRKLTTIASKTWRGQAGRDDAEPPQRGSNTGRQRQSRDKSVKSSNNIDNDGHHDNEHNEIVNRQVGGEYLEVSLISAQGLKDVSRMFERMSPYVVVWVDPAYKLRTELAQNGGSSPVWDYCIRVPMGSYNTSTNRPPPAAAAAAKEAASSTPTPRVSTSVYCPPRQDHHHSADPREQEPILTVQICNQGDTSDVLLGSATIPLRDIIRCQSNRKQQLHYMACQLMRPSGRIQGLLNLSLQYVSQSSPCSTSGGYSSQSTPRSSAGGYVSQSTHCSSSGESASAHYTPSLRNAPASSESATLQPNTRNSWAFLSTKQTQDPHQNARDSWASHSPMQASNFGGSMQAPDFGGSMQAPDFGGSMQAPNFGGFTQTPNFGGSMQTPNFSGSMQTHNFSGLSQHHQQQSSQEQSSAMDSQLFLGVAAAGAAMHMSSPSVLGGDSPGLMMQIGGSSGVDVQQVVGNAAAMAGLAAYMSQAPSVSPDCSQLPPS